MLFHRVNLSKFVTNISISGSQENPRDTKQCQNMTKHVKPNAQQCTNNVNKHKEDQTPGNKEAEQTNTCKNHVQQYKKGQTMTNKAERSQHKANQRQTIELQKVTQSEPFGT